MPTSVADRLTTPHEAVSCCTRSRRYFFDLDALRQQMRTAQKQTMSNPDRTYPPDSARLDGRRASANSGLGKLKVAGLAGHPLRKNPGEVWSLPTTDYSGAHFATLSLARVERPLLATTPERVCTCCGRGWQRELTRHGERLLSIGPLQPACCCGVPGLPGVVLAPFLGGGTTAIAAERHGRDWVGNELNGQSAALAEERMDTVRAASRHAT